MNKTEYLQFAEAELGRVLTIVRKKNSDYTGGVECTDPFANFNISEDFGVPPLTGLCVRMADKFQRVKTFCRDGRMSQENEGAVDAFRDIIGYSLIALGMLHDTAPAVSPENVSPPFEGPVVGFPKIQHPHVPETDFGNIIPTEAAVVGKLVSGGRYEDRRGRIVMITATANGFTYPFEGDNGIPYYSTGNQGREYAIGSSSYDLVKVVSEPQAGLAPQDEPQVAPEHCPPNILNEPPHPVTKLKLQLEAGKTYRNRIGDIVRIAGPSSTKTFPWVDEGGTTYTDEGLYLLCTGGMCLDLIEEVVDEPQDTVAPKVVKGLGEGFPAAISLKVGGVYRNRLGQERTIVEDRGEGYRFPFEDNERSYTKDGHHFFSTPDDFDLVEVVSEPAPQNDNPCPFS
jgi:hypothetical protein